MAWMHSPALLSKVSFAILDKRRYDDYRDNPDRLRILDSYEETLPESISKNIILKDLSDPNYVKSKIKDFLTNNDPIYIHHDILYELAKRSDLAASMLYVVIDGRMPLYDTLIAMAASTDNDKILAYLLGEDRLRISSSMRSYKDVQMTVLKRKPWTIARVELQSNKNLMKFLTARNIPVGNYESNVAEILNYLYKNNLLSVETKKILPHLRGTFNIENDELIHLLNSNEIPVAQVTKGVVVMLLTLAELIKFQSREREAINSLRSLIKTSTSLYNANIFVNSWLWSESR